MIDYEKLKTAIELTNKIHLGKLHMNSSTHDGVEYIFQVPFQNTYYSSSIDDLIAKLRELTKPEPKYKCGDIVWFTYEADMCSALIKQSRIIDEEVSYLFEDFIPIRECDLFPTRQALIEHQIEYWQSLQEDQRDVETMLYDESKKLWPNDNAECQHDWHINVHGYTLLFGM